MLLMGRVGAPQGLQGWVHVQSHTEPVANLLDYKTWNLCLRGEWQSRNVLEGRVQGKDLVVHLEGCHSREAAMTLLHADIGIARQDLPALEAGEYYWADLMGLQVQTEEGHILGQVEGFLETGSNNVVIVKGETREHLIPYVEEIILGVDLEKGLMHVSWDPDF